MSLKKPWILFICFLTGCNNIDQGVEPLRRDVLISQTECINATKQIVKEWKEAGGGYKKSLFEIRNQIKKDSISRFSEMVREFWRYQRERQFFVKLEKIGQWPITDESYRQVFFNTVNVDNYLPKKCGLSWLANEFHDSILIEDLTNTGLLKDPLEEYPKNLSWESNEAQQWLKYWLFVNLKE